MCDDVSGLFTNLSRYAAMRTEYHQEATRQHEQDRMERESLKEMHNQAQEAMDHRHTQIIQECMERDAELNEQVHMLQIENSRLSRELKNKDETLQHSEERVEILEHRADRLRQRIKRVPGAIERIVSKVSKSQQDSRGQNEMKMRSKGMAVDEKW
jgi:chromosome segregation ATPase